MRRQQRRERSREVLSLLAITSTKVQTLARYSVYLLLLVQKYKHWRGTQFTCFTNTKVHILTPPHQQHQQQRCLRGRRGSWSRWGKTRKMWGGEAPEASLS